MTVTVTIEIDESEQRAIELQLARSGSAETIDQLVSRMAQKVVRGWAAQNRQEFIAKNRPAIETLVTELATDPDRDEKLSALGYQFVNGVLVRIEGSP